MSIAKHKTDKSLSIVIPAFNDSGTIGLLIEEAIAIAKTVTDDYEVFVIDDGSTDDTRRVVAKLATADSRIKLGVHPCNMGYGWTMKELYSAATKELVFSCPGDGQIPPAQLLKMLPALKDYDLVIGHREKRRDGIARSIQTVVYNMLVRTLYGVNTKDINSVKLFKRAILDCFQIISTSPFVDAELCIRAGAKGFKVGEVVIEHLPRQFKGNNGGSLSMILSTFTELVKQRKVLKNGQYLRNK